MGNGNGGGNGGGNGTDSNCGNSAPGRRPIIAPTPSLIDWM
jgi:hypothetical protein